MGETRLDGERRLGAQLERMSHRTTAIHRMLEDSAAPLDATGWLLVRLIGSRGPMRAKDVAEISRLSRPTVSRCLAALGRAGFVRTEPDPDDGRAAIVQLTETGHRQIDTVVAASHERVRAITVAFTAAEIDTLAELLDRLNDAAEAHTYLPDRYALEPETA